MDRTWHPTKAAWAAAKAREARQAIDSMPTCYASDWRGVKRRMRSIEIYNATAAKFDRLAARFAAAGQ